MRVHCNTHRRVKQTHTHDPCSQMGRSIDQRHDYLLRCALSGDAESWSARSGGHTQTSYPHCHGPSQSHRTIARPLDPSLLMPPCQRHTRVPAMAASRPSPGLSGSHHALACAQLRASNVRGAPVTARGDAACGGAPWLLPATRGAHASEEASASLLEGR